MRVTHTRDAAAYHMEQAHVAIRSAARYCADQPGFLTDADASRLDALVLLVGIVNENVADGRDYITASKQGGDNAAVWDAIR